MIDGLRMWRDAPSSRDAVIDSIDHSGWQVEQRLAGLGVVGFVFEGRPNVFADACGVLRSGNSVVFRIGSDALGTARAIVTNALDPALAEAGLPPGAAGPDRQRRPRRRVGDVQRPPIGTRGRPGQWACGRPARRGRPPGRHGCELARHRWRLGGDR